jgi:hypothetical protein
VDVPPGWARHTWPRRRYPQQCYRKTVSYLLDNSDIAGMRLIHGVVSSSRIVTATGTDSVIAYMLSRKAPDADSFSVRGCCPRELDKPTELGATRRLVEGRCKNLRGLLHHGWPRWEVATRLDALCMARDDATRTLPGCPPLPPAEVHQIGVLLEQRQDRAFHKRAEPHVLLV